jgi:archaellum component FlaF (FlaF/FlaG flagellin family)
MYFSSHKALSSIVTGMVLLVATVILGSAVVMWSNGTFSVSKSITTTLYANNVNKFTEQLVVENAWFGNTPSKFINVTLYNVGSTGVTIADIKIKNSTKTVDISVSKGNILPQTTNSTKISYGWTSKIPVSIIITTTKGSVITKDASP